MELNIECGTSTANEKTWELLNKLKFILKCAIHRMLFYFPLSQHLTVDKCFFINCRGLYLNPGTLVLVATILATVPQLDLIPITDS